ncbi:MAG: hypothetical protein IH934_04240 [Nanoarchaeota archaeon]|nr:hypothetical protein [Nanoarchaeota archaeon]
MDNQIKQLAETLQKTGIAASMYEAIEKAKSILKVNIQKPENSEENTQNIQQNQEIMPNIGAEIKEDTTLNELMREVNVSPEEVKKQEQEKIEDIQEEVNGIKETEESQESKNEQKDMFEQEKKIDLTKIFGNKK